MKLFTKSPDYLGAYGAMVRQIWMSKIVQIEASIYRDDYDRLEKAYRIRDPWNMNSDREQQRFQAINEFIRQNCGTIDSMLEIGSGEGHHTEHLLGLANDIVGIEVSAKAIARAQQRCPCVRFFQFPFPHLPQRVEGLRPQYDLVIASEVLYYMHDIDRAIEAMSKYGRFCLVTCYERELDCVDKHIKTIPAVVHKDMAFDSLRYRIYLWSPRRHS